MVCTLVFAALAGCGGSGDDDDDLRGQIDAADNDQITGDEDDAAPPDAPVIDAAPLPDAAPPDAAAPAIVVTPSAGLVVDESGTTAQFTISLTTQPANPIGMTLSISDGTEIDASPLFLVYGVDSWEPIVVTVTGLPDGVTDGDQLVTIEVPPATSTDPDYGGFDAPDVTVTNVDLD